MGDLRIGSLFAGIGGLELGLEWAGVGHTAWQVEREPLCQRVLSKHWPHAVRFDDVTQVGAHNLPRVDVICGGFPCQDISYAGKGAGLAGERSGLWYEFARIIRELEPRFVVVENVAALPARGLDAVLGTLADLGYDAEWSCVRASDVGARHRRERVFVIAWLADRERDGLQNGEPAGATSRAARGAGQVADRDGGRRPIERLAEHLDEQGAPWREPDRCGPGRRRDGAPVGEHRREYFQRWADSGGLPTTESEGAREAIQRQRGRHSDCDAGTPGGRARGAARGQAEPSLGRATHGLPGRLDVARPGEPQAEWEAPRVVTQAPDRAARLKALGNAVVPQVAEIVGRRLLAIAEREGLL